MHSHEWTDFSRSLWNILRNPILIYYVFKYSCVYKYIYQNLKKFGKDPDNNSKNTILEERMKN